MGKKIRQTISLIHLVDSRVDQYCQVKQIGFSTLVTLFVAKAANVFNLFADLKVSTIERISLNLTALAALTSTIISAKVKVA